MQCTFDSYAVVQPSRNRFHFSKRTPECHGRRRLSRATSASSTASNTPAFRACRNIWRSTLSIMGRNVRHNRPTSAAPTRSPSWATSSSGHFLTTFNNWEIIIRTLNYKQIMTFVSFFLLLKRHNRVRQIQWQCSQGATGVRESQLWPLHSMNAIHRSIPCKVYR